MPSGLSPVALSRYGKRNEPLLPLVSSELNRPAGTTQLSSLFVHFNGPVCHDRSLLVNFETSGSSGVTQAGLLFLHFNDPICHGSLFPLTLIPCAASFASTRTTYTTMNSITTKMVLEEPNSFYLIRSSTLVSTQIIGFFKKSKVVAAF